MNVVNRLVTLLQKLLQAPTLRQNEWSGEITIILPSLFYSHNEGYWFFSNPAMIPRSRLDIHSPIHPRSKQELSPPLQSCIILGRTPLFPVVVRHLLEPCILHLKPLDVLDRSYQNLALARLHRVVPLARPSSMCRLQVWHR